jgi:hypothetical protein
MLIKCPVCDKEIAQDAATCPGCGHSFGRGFIEFEDRDYCDWKRLRTAIEHENHLINHRLTWLFSSQTFLIAAAGLVLGAWLQKDFDPSDGWLPPSLISAIGATGMLIAAVIFDSVRRATLALDELNKWWTDKSLPKPAHPPIQLWGYLTVWHPLRVTFLPLWCIVLWLLVIAIAIDKATGRTTSALITQHGPSVALCLGGVLIGYFLRVFLTRNKS